MTLFDKVAPNDIFEEVLRVFFMKNPNLAPSKQAQLLVRNQWVSG